MLVPDVLRGVLVPELGIFGLDRRDPSETTATQGGLLSGLAEPDSDSLASIEIGGEPWTGESWTLRILRTGSAGPGSTAARFSWIPSDESERGWLGYNAVCGFNFLSGASVYDSATYPGFGTATKPTILRLQSGDTLIAFQHSSGGIDYIGCARYDASVGHFAPSYGHWSGSAWSYPDRDAWIFSQVVSETDAGNTPIVPALLQLASGRILCFYSVNKTFTGVGGGTFYVVGFSWSDDDGATWTLGSTDTGIRVESTTPYLLSVARTPSGYLQLILSHDGGGGNSALQHWYSTDGGGSWTAVSETLSDCWCGQLTACDDGSVLLWYIGSDNKGYTSRISEPAQDFTSRAVVVSPPGAADTTYAKDQDSLGVCVLDDHTIQLGLVVGDSGSFGKRLRMIRFPQDVAGKSDAILQFYGEDPAEPEPLDYGDGNGGSQRAYLRALGVWGSSLLGLWDTPGGSPQTLMQIFGGYSSIDWIGPSFGILPQTASEVRYGAWWDAAYLPSQCAIWSVTGSGTEGTSIERLLKLNFSGGSSSKDYARNGTAGADAWAWIRVRVESGGSLTATEVGVRLQAANGTNDYTIDMRLSMSGIRLHDQNSPGTIGADTTGLTTGQMRDYLVSLTAGGRACVWYKATGSTEWLQGPHGNATNNTGSPGSYSRVRWGSIASSTSVSSWAFVGSCCDGWSDTPTSISEPAQARVTQGRELSLWPQFVVDGQNALLSSIPAMGGESWSISPRYSYGLDNLDPALHPSPRESWHSSSDSDEQIIQWSPDALDRPLSGAIGVYLRCPNFLTFYLEYYYDGDWQQATLTTTTIISGFFERAGSVVYPTSTGGSVAVGKDELKGSWVVLTNSGDKHYAQITANSEGTWNSATGIQQCRIRLTGDMGSLPSGGTIQIIAPEIATIVDLDWVYPESWRVRIPARSYVVADQSFHSLSCLLIGSFLPFGKQPSNGSTYGMEPLQEIAEYPNGRRSVRALAPRPRRNIEVVWTDQEDARDIYGDEPTPEAVGLVADKPLAHRTDPRRIESLLLASEGARIPLVYLARIPAGGGTIRQRDLLLYGRAVSSTTRTQVVGEEGEHVIQTISALRIEEEL